MSAKGQKWMKREGVTTVFEEKPGGVETIRGNRADRRVNLPANINGL
jgi:hypothetical protein